MNFSYYVNSKRKMLDEVLIKKLAEKFESEVCNPSGLADQILELAKNN